MAVTLLYSCYLLTFAEKFVYGIWDHLPICIPMCHFCPCHCLSMCIGPSYTYRCYGWYWGWCSEWNSHQRRRATWNCSQGNRVLAIITHSVDCELDICSSEFVHQNVYNCFWAFHNGCVCVLLSLILGSLDNVNRCVNSPLSCHCDC